MRTIHKRIKKATSTPKGRIVFFSILLLILCAIAAGLLYWNFYKKQIIRTKLESAIKEKSKGLYSVKYDSLSLDEVAGDLSAKNFRLTYDSNKYMALLKEGDVPPTLLTISIPSLSVAGVKTPRALLSKEIVGKKLQINDPVIDIFYTHAGKDSTRNAPTKEVYEQILGNLNLIHIDTVLISNATITTRDLRTGVKKVQMMNTNIQLVNVAVDSAGDADTSRILFAKEVVINVAKIAWSPEKKYDYNLDSVSLSTVSKNVHIGAFRLRPLLDEASFTRSLRLADDRFDFSVQDINISNIDFAQLSREELVADSVIINSATFKIYRDISLPHDRLSRVGTYPSQAVMKSSLPMNIRSIVFNNTFVEYKERNAKTGQAGKVQFYNTRATVSNVTNKPELVKANNVMVVDAVARFLGKAPLHANWKFYLGSPNGRFDLKGTLGEIDATQLNVLTVPMGPARIEKGVIHSLQFNLAATDYAMSGKVTMLYDDLKVAVLQKDDDTKEVKKKKLASLAANVMIKNSNPSGNKTEPRTTDAKFQRDTHRSMFHMTWKTIFKGVKESVGINQ
jgi:hypothetical protein